MIQTSFFLAGKFGAPQGIKGQVRVVSFLEEPGTLFDWKLWYLPANTSSIVLPNSAPALVQGVDVDNSGAHLQVYSITPKYWQPHSKGFAVTLSSILDRNQAQRLTHTPIYLPLAQLKALSNDEVYWRQLLGLTVFDITGAHRGVIADIFETGANDVLVVTSNQSFQDNQKKPTRILVPYIPDRVIKSIDLVQSTIVLDWDFDDL